MNTARIIQAGASQKESMKKTNIARTIGPVSENKDVIQSLIVIAVGHPIGVSGTTNMLRMERLKA